MPPNHARSDNHSQSKRAAIPLVAISDASGSTIHVPERRERLRAVIAKAVILQVGTHRIAAELVDISLQGGRIIVPHHATTLVTGPIVLALSATMQLPGRICWKSENVLGVEFIAVLQELDAVVAQEYAGRDFYAQTLQWQRLRRGGIAAAASPPPQTSDVTQAECARRLAEAGSGYRR